MDSALCENVDFVIRWLPLFLDPAMGEQGTGHPSHALRKRSRRPAVDRRSYAEKKLGRAQAEELVTKLKAAAGESEIRLRDAGPIATSLHCHRLVEWAWKNAPGARVRGYGCIHGIDRVTRVACTESSDTGRSRVQGELVELMLSGIHEGSLDMTSVDELTNLAVAAGLPGTKARQYVHFGQRLFACMHTDEPSQNACWQGAAI